jgi:hypothetical protein
LGWNRSLGFGSKDSGCPITGGRAIGENHGPQAANSSGRNRQIAVAQAKERIGLFAASRQHRIRRARLMAG